MAAAAVGVPVLSASPALAAACGDGHGVTVVVEHRQLGGGTDVSCDAGGGGDAAAQQFEDAGHPLTYASRQPGFVCRVDDVPQSDPCVNTSPQDAYWGLWWSDGRSGTWTYASLGADSLEVPDGGYVDFVWHQGSGTTAPATAATPHPSATPTPTPVHSATPSPTHPPTPPVTHSAPATSAPTPVPTATPTPDPTPSVVPTTAVPTPTQTRSATPSTRPTRSSAAPLPVPVPSSTPTPTSVPTSVPTAGSTRVTEEGHPLPWWVVGVVILVVFGSALALALARGRRR